MPIEDLGEEINIQDARVGPSSSHTHADIFLDIFTKIRKDRDEEILVDLPKNREKKGCRM